MKKILFIIAAFCSLTAFSQERVYLSTDKNCYVAGDRIWCSAFCLNVASNPISVSNISSTVYIELQSNAAVAQVAKIALVEGRGAGALEISPDLPTGNYKILAYTAHNKNEEGFVPDGKTITIFNTLSSERVKDNVLTSEEEPSQPSVLSSKVLSEVGKGIIDLSLPANSQKISSEVPFSIKNNSDGAVSLSVSIYHQDGLGALPRVSIKDAFSKIKKEALGSITNKVIPDYEGEVIRLQTANIKNGVAHVSFPGKGIDYYISEIDSNGIATIYTTNIIGDRDLICEIDSPSVPSTWSVSIEDPFIKKVKGDIPHLSIGNYMEERLQNRGFSMQIERRFEADTLYNRLPTRQNTFLYGNCVKYPLDNYTRFPLMEEVIIEFVSEMKVRKIQKQPHICVLNYEHSIVLLDGVPVFDHKKILDYDPLLVKEIIIYPTFYSAGLLYYEGVACLNTYKGDLPSYTFSDNVKILPYKGALIPMSYTGSNILNNNKYPDYRQTIYWNPIVEISAGEVFDFKCITPLYEGIFDVVVEGVSEAGEPIFYKSTFSTL